MFKAEIYFTIGHGVDKGTLSAKTEEELKNKVELWKETTVGKEVKVLGHTSKIVLVEIKFL